MRILDFSLFLQTSYNVMTAMNSKENLKWKEENLIVVCNNPFKEENWTASTAKKWRENFLPSCPFILPIFALLSSKNGKLCLLNLKYFEILVANALIFVGFITSDYT